MFKVLEWEAPPADFEKVVWKGDNDQVGDAPAVMHLPSKISIMKLELSEQDRRQLIEGNPLYLSFWGAVTPFAVSVNLSELTEFAREIGEN